MTEPTAHVPAGDPAEVRELFHRLNNQLGIILAHAELIEAKAADEAQRSRAGQVVAAAVEAMSLARRIRDGGSRPSGNR